MKMLVLSTPYPGRDEEYDTWYETVHIPDMLDVPNVKSCNRFRVHPDAPGVAGATRLAVYEITGEPADIMAELVARTRDGRLRPGTASDPAGSQISFWQAL